MTDTYRTPPEAAKCIHHSIRTLERWRVEGTGPDFVKAGRKILYADSALKAWLDARTFRSIAEADAAAAQFQQAVEQPQPTLVGRSRPTRQPGDAAAHGEDEVYDQED